MSKQDSEEESLLDPSTMDGPTVPWTVADLSASSPSLGMIYHTLGAGYDYGTPFGAALGLLLYPAGFRRATSVLQQAGNFGLMGGALGMTAGALGMASIARKGENQERPWNEEGIEDRFRGIQNSFNVRVVDLSVWTGIAVAGGALIVAGGPRALKLAPGTLGALQALSVGSSVGSFAGMACIFSVNKK